MTARLDVFSRSTPVIQSLMMQYAGASTAFKMQCVCKRWKKIISGTQNEKGMYWGIMQQQISKNSLFFEIHSFESSPYQNVCKFTQALERLKRAEDMLDDV